MAQTHQRGRQSVDEDERVLCPCPDSLPPRPSRHARLMLFVPQRPYLGDEFSDHGQGDSPATRHSVTIKSRAPAPIMLSSTSYPGAEPRSTVHEVVSGSYPDGWRNAVEATFERAASGSVVPSWETVSMLINMTITEDEWGTEAVAAAFTRGLELTRLPCGPWGAGRGPLARCTA